LSVSSVGRKVLDANRRDFRAMEWLKGPLRRLVATILRLRLRLSGRRVGVVILYHRLDENHAGWDPTGINPAIDVGLFEAEVRHLRGHYRVVPASKLLDAVRARKRGERIPVAVTFDDDNASHAAKAMPILKRAAMPATFFVCGASLERPFAFWWERVERALASGVVSVQELRGMVPESSLNSGSTKSGMRAIAADIEFMPPEDRDAIADELARRLGPDPPDAGLRASALRELRSAGFDLGFHTLRHHNLTRLDDQRLSSAMRDGREALETAVGGELAPMIAYPGGKWDERVVSAARAAGYDPGFGFTTDSTPVEPDSDPLALGRLDVIWCGTLSQFALAVTRTLRERS
jgi:peptidoglycan/xylan/chitin deacetylase (PgdA/CDA1 family)